MPGYGGSALTKPRRRRCADSVARQPEPSWIDLHRETIVAKTLYRLRGLRVDQRTKEAAIRAAVEADANLP